MNYVISNYSDIEVHPNCWRDFFDVVICSARKPEFYSSSRSFRKLNIEQNCPTPASVSILEKGSVYIGGSVQVMKRLKGWSGSEVLYVGDNLWADLVEARRTHGWHTACIINELDNEVAVQSSPEFLQLHYLRSTIRNFFVEFQDELNRIDNASDAECGDDSDSAFIKSPFHESEDKFDICKETRGNRTLVDELFISSLEAELKRINKIMSEMFNPNFGTIFRTHGHSSLFAFSLRRYVDLYMSSVTCFIKYSPSHRFYPTQSVHMAHDPVVDHSPSPRTADSGIRR